LAEGDVPLGVLCGGSGRGSAEANEGALQMQLFARARWLMSPFIEFIKIISESVGGLL